MRRLTVGMVALALIVGGIHQAGADLAVLDTEVNPSNGHTYYLLAPSTWTEAEAKAVTLGGHLATIRDANEELWIWNTFAEPLPNNALTRMLWVGLNDAAQEGTFVWADGEPITYTDWAPGQPSHYQEPGGTRLWEPYVQMGYYGYSRPCAWNDCLNVAYLGSLPLQGVVETPEPSALVLLGIGAISLLAYAWRRRRAM